MNIAQIHGRKTSAKTRAATYPEMLSYLGIPLEHWTYKTFLSSRYWWQCRNKVLERDQRCINCGSTCNLEVHHLTYEHHGDELNHLEDLVTLCHACHAITHGKTPSRRGGGLEHVSMITEQVILQVIRASGTHQVEPKELQES